MHVNVQKSRRTARPRSPAGSSGGELSQPVAPENEGRCWCAATVPSVPARGAAREDGPVTVFDDLAGRVRAGELDAAGAAWALLAELTPKERLWLLDGDLPLWRGMLRLARAFNRTRCVGGAVQRLGVPGIRFTDGPRGIVLGRATSFPVTIARAATFDPELESLVGEAIGREGRVLGANLFAGICVNVARHPGWGRSQESYGEDPLVLGRMGAALVRGVAAHLMTCVKHFALNSMEEARFVVDVRVDEADLHEWYLPHFKAVVDAGVDSVMTAYNRVNGEWAGQHRYLITEVLRNRWGFTGFVQSDWVFGFRDAVASVKAGLDLEMPFRQQRRRALPKALREGRLQPSDVDEACLRLLGTQLRYAARVSGPVPDLGVVAGPEHRALAREVASRSAVLLRNETVGDTLVLPLGAGTVAVLGRLADAANLGDTGSSVVHPPSTCSIREGLTEALGTTRIVDDPAQADAAVVVVGLTPRDEGEFLVAQDPEALGLLHPVLRRLGRLARILAPGKGTGGDRRDLRLHPEDVRLIGSVAAANARIVVVVIGGGAVVMDPWRHKVGAILVGWYPGMEGGRGLADVLLGAREPGGRLPFAIVAED